MSIASGFITNGVSKKFTFNSSVRVCIEEDYYVVYADDGSHSKWAVSHPNSLNSIKNMLMRFFINSKEDEYKTLEAVTDRINYIMNNITHSTVEDVCDSESGNVSDWLYNIAIHHAAERDDSRWSWWHHAERSSCGHFFLSYRNGIKNWICVEIPSKYMELVNSNILYSEDTPIRAGDENIKLSKIKE